MPAERGLLAELGVGLRHGEYADGLVVGARGEAAAVAAPVDRVHLGGVGSVLAGFERFLEFRLQFPQLRRFPGGDGGRKRRLRGIGRGLGGRGRRHDDE